MLEKDTPRGEVAVLSSTQKALKKPGTIRMRYVFGSAARSDVACWAGAWIYCEQSPQLPVSGFSD